MIFKTYDGTENSFYHTYINKESKTHKTFKEFYKVDQFKIIKNYFDNNEIISCVGFCQKSHNLTILKHLEVIILLFPNHTV